MSDPSWAERPWEDAAAVADKKRGMTTSGKVLLGLFIVSPVLFFGGCMALLTSGSNEPSAPTDTEARNQCQEWIKAKLKSPSTAEFSGQVVSGGPVSWTATGAVDSENSFGATVRSTWSCEIKLIGDQWNGQTRLVE